MAHTKSARKRIRQSAKKQQRNTSLKSKMKTSIKKVLQAIQTGDVHKSEELLVEAVRTIQSTHSKGVIHQNNASRRVSRLTLKVNELKNK